MQPRITWDEATTHRGRRAGAFASDFITTRNSSALSPITSKTEALPGFVARVFAVAFEPAALNASALVLHRVCLAGAGAPLCDETLPSQL